MVLALDDIVRARAPAGLLETVPTYRSLTVQFDPAETDYDALSGSSTRRRRIWRPARPSAGAGACRWSMAANTGAIWRTWRKSTA